MTLDRLAWFIGEIARPVGIIASCLAASIASVVMATRVTDGNDGYLLAGAIWLGAGVIFGAKALEERGKAKSAADVQIARSGVDRRQPQEVIIKNEPGDAVPVEEVAT